MEKNQSKFYEKAGGVNISLEQYDYLKNIEREVDKVKDEYKLEKDESIMCMIKFVLNIKDIINETDINNAMTKAGYTFIHEMDSERVLKLGAGSRVIKFKF